MKGVKTGFKEFPDVLVVLAGVIVCSDMYFWDDNLIEDGFGRQ